MKTTWAAGCVAALLSASAFAQAVRVEAVQYPAWLERGGFSVPLVPGTELRAQDGLRTGRNARAVLRLAEGSTVKLGENARFRIERVEQKSVFRAALQVIAGAFRFTTRAIAKRQRRDVTIRVSSITAGIRGTDVWGKATGERDLVCLFEGRVQVAAEGREPVTLDQPRDFYQKPRDGEPVLARVDAAQVETWSRETEIPADGGAATVGGTWRVVASKFQRRDTALALRSRLRAAGYPAQVIDEKNGVFVVQVPGLAGELQARAVMANLRGIEGVTIPSVGAMGGAGG
ncbi:MAG TPA: FecR domain-containing protein [Usitatibacter sp.]|nr:FecR domain-containing protein [Usitatibacter sp.]